jgi:hypothetical protein
MSSLERSRTAGLYALDTGHEKIKRMSEYRIQHVRPARMSSLERSRTAGLYALDTGQERSKYCQNTGSNMSAHRGWAAWRGPEPPDCMLWTQDRKRLKECQTDILLQDLLPGKDATDILLKYLLLHLFYSETANWRTQLILIQPFSP